MKSIKIEIPDGKKAEWINGVLTLVDEQDNRPVTERIKTFEDACKAQGIDPKKWLEENETGKMDADVLAYLKLRIIAAALNEGWEPQFTTEEYRYYPWFYLYTEEELKDKSDKWKKEHALVLWGGSARNGAGCGLACAASNFAFSSSDADFGARLAVKNEKLAVYFGKQFIEIWKDYCVIVKAEEQ